MSTFSGISTALSSLQAQRQGLDTAGQNVANANTVGYTRQRAIMTAQTAGPVPAMFSTAIGAPGDGVRVTDIQRLNDTFLDAQVRAGTSSASYTKVRETAYATLEAGFGEPDETALSSQMDEMWAAFQDLSNHPEETANRTVVLSTTSAVADKLSALYDGVRTQWSQARTATVALVDQANGAAATVADLNQRILAMSNSGASSNELQDQRDTAITQLSSLVGATTLTRADGTIDVLVGGNPMVEGVRSHALAVGGAQSFEQAVTGATVSLSWAARPGTTVRPEGGEVAGRLSVLAPTDASGNGGVLTEAAARLDSVATSLATQVNALHSTGYRVDGTPATAFFSLTPGAGAATSLKVALTDPAQVAVSGSADAAYDGTVADRISLLGTATTGPHAVWTAAVVEVGNRAASATSRAAVAEHARSSAESQQLANNSVDTDEETVNMLAYQRGYQAAARVLSTIDEMLQTLINM